MEQFFTLAKAFVILVCISVLTSFSEAADDKETRCSKVMTFGWGDAVDQRLRCSVDPNGKPINTMAMHLLSSTISGAGRFIKVHGRSNDDSSSSSGRATISRAGADGVRRDGRMLDASLEVFDSLVLHTKLQNGEKISAMGRSDAVSGVCSDGCVRASPETCCDVRTEVAYPQFGQSAVSEETFTIIQDFPDFVQPVFKRVCATTQCNIILGNCTQKFVPHAVFSAPSGKFGNLFGQDYLLVESGCECMPYSRPVGNSPQPPAGNSPQPTERTPSTTGNAPADGVLFSSKLNTI